MSAMGLGKCPLSLSANLGSQSSTLDLGPNNVLRSLLIRLYTRLLVSDQDLRAGRKGPHATGPVLILFVGAGAGGGGGSSTFPNRSPFPFSTPTARTDHESCRVLLLVLNGGQMSNRSVQSMRSSTSEHG